MSIISQSTGIDTVFGTNFDCRLERVDANTIQLIGVEGTSKRAFVRDIAIPIYDAITLDTDSASEYIITGSGTVAKGGALSSLTDNDYNNYGLHYVYYCNDNDCWNFDGYDRRRQLIISATPPIEEGGYLHDWGDGANARHVGWIALNSSRQFDNDFCIASVFNPVPVGGKFNTGVAQWTAMTEYQVTTEFNNMSTMVITPANWVVQATEVVCYENNTSTYLACDFWLRKDTSLVANVHLRACNSSAYAEQNSGSASYSFSETSTVVRKISSAYNINQASGGSPQYFESYSYLIVTRIPPQSPAGFTRQFTQEYEAIARTVNGGRIEYVSDTEIQWQPSVNGSIGLYNGLNWEIVTPATTPSAANTATTISGGALAVDTNYDVFATYVSATELQLDFQEWASATGRYQDIAVFEGVKVYADTNEGRKKRWIGTIRMDDDTGAKFKDEKTLRFINNFYNKKRKDIGIVSPYSGTASDDANLSAGTWYSWYSNGDSWKIEFITDGVEVLDLSAGSVEVVYAQTGDSNAAISIGIDSKSPSSDSSIDGFLINSDQSRRGDLGCHYNGIPQEGYHYAYPIVMDEGGNRLRFYYGYKPGSYMVVNAHFSGIIRC